MRTAPLAALLASALALASAEAAAAPKNPDTLTYVAISDIDTLDPAYAYDTASHNIILNLYETLFFFEGSSTEKLVPLVAAKVPSRANGLLSKDGRVYTIPIRKGIEFHDGTPLTPEDVRYSLLRFMLLDRDAGPSPILLEPLLGYASTRDAAGKLKPHAFKDAERAVQVKGDSVVLSLPRPYAPLLGILAAWAPVVSRSWAAAKGDWDGSEAALARFNNPEKSATALYPAENGSGPFKLDRWDRRTHELHLVRHDGYWRKPAALKRVIVKGVNEPGTRKLMLQAGDADVVYADRPVYSQFAGIPGVTITDELPMMELNPTVFFTFKLNAAGNPHIGSGRLDGQGIPPDFFSDPDLRKAFAYSFDHDGYLKDVFMGKGRRARGILPSTLLGYDPAARMHSFDLKKAEEHFRKAMGGQVWEKGFRFTLTFNSGNPSRQALCQILKSKVESLNPKFRIDVRAIEWPSFLDSYKTSKLPIFVLGWTADYPDPHSFAFPLLHSKGDYPVTQRFAVPELDALVEQANAETDPAVRRRLYKRLQDLAFDLTPHFTPIEPFRYRTQRDWVKGFTHNAVFPDAPYGSYYYTLRKE